jgi:tetratricopeptide (TPR) repeat protein
MKLRSAIIGGAALLLLAAAGGGALWVSRDGAPAAQAADDTPAPPPPPESQASDSAALPLPLPPVPPRIAQGDDYERCLAMLDRDPEGARTMAETWQSSNGGEGAAHCLALATIELGEPETGAQMLEQLAGTSKAADLARAAVFGQAGQAWLMAGDAGRAYGATTLALALSPNDPDLRIDRAVAAGTLKHFADAIADLDRALDIDPRRPDALVLRGSAWRHDGQLDLARDDIDRALAQDPENAEAYLESGILRQRRGDVAGAHADWEHAMKLAPDTPTADLAQQNLALLEAGPARQ